MWFKNLQLYRLGQTFDLSPEVLDERLQSDAFKGCNSMDMLTYGWARRRWVAMAGNWCMLRMAI